MSIFYFLRKERPYTHMPEALGGRLNVLVFCFFSFSVIFFLVTQFLRLRVMGSIASTFFFYTFFLPLVLGAQVTYMRFSSKVCVLTLFCFMLFSFMVVGSRGYLVIPVFAFLVGFFLLSRVRTTTKLVVILAVLVAFPAYMIIGNTVRAITGRKGFEDIGYNIQALKEWKTVAEVTPWAASTFGRLFFTGGHSIITKTPSEAPYSGFYPGLYLKETAVMLVPEKISGPIHQRVYLRGTYAGNYVLLDYGFDLRKEFQVGVTLLGHFWLLGGYPFIVAGAIVVALLQGLIIRLVNRALAQQPEKALFYAAIVLTPMIWMSGRSFIITFRNIFWQIVLAIAFYNIFIRPFLKKYTYDQDSSAPELLEQEDQLVYTNHIAEHSGK
jgi:hypothetical protein